MKPARTTTRQPNARRAANAKRLRNDFASLIGPRHSELARKLRELRPWAKQSLATYDDRKAYFEELVEEALR